MIFRIAMGLLIAGVAAAQPPRRAPTPNDTLKSPEVLPDNHVVFRIYAPKATEVTVGGDWVTQGRGTAGKLEKQSPGRLVDGWRTDVACCTF